MDLKLAGEHHVRELDTARVAGSAAFLPDAHELGTERLAILRREEKGGGQTPDGMVR